MAGLRYDESNIVARLSELSPRARTLFAASAAERLFALYEWYAERASRADPAKLREALDLAWSAVGTDVPEDDVARWQDIAEELVPDEEDEGWTEQTAYGENGAAAAAYALCVARTGDPQEAGWAGLQLYEAADYAAQRQLEDLDLNEPGAEDALADQPVVQAALQAIEDDLAAAERETAIDEARGRAREGGLRLAELAGRASA
jgi:cation transport regulator ChaB